MPPMPRPTMTAGMVSAPSKMASRSATRLTGRWSRGSNQEAAARLFLSHKTAEVHLSHIYEKLGVHSRTGMLKLISSGAVEE